MSNRILRFADFELDHGRYQLRHGDRVLKLEKIPMDLLILLLEANGQLVTREQIVERLWGKEVYLDTEHGINTAVRKIRLALHDAPDNPRFVGTVTGRGYRFIAPLSEVPVNGNGFRSQPNASDTSTETDALPAQTHSPEDVTRAPELRLSSPGSALAPEVTRTGVSRRHWPLIAATVVLCLAAAAALLALNPGLRDRLFSAHRASQISSIAVLPLNNLSGDPSQDYFADGMTDELTTMLAKNTSLRVVSRTSAMQYKGAKRPLGEIARELGVDGILEGSISRAADHVHMTVQLIYAPTDSHVWAESYDRDSSQALSLPAELSQTLAARLKITAANIRPQRHINPEAHDTYLRGRYLWFRGDNIHSQEYFEKAIQIQPDYATAWSGLADSYATSGMDLRPAAEVAQKVEAAARKAVELDGSLAEAHHSMAAWYLFYAWDLPHAEAESKRAIELDPKLAEAHHLRSYILMSMKHPDEALREQQRSTELAPFERPWTLGRTYLQLRQFDAAISELLLRIQALPEEHMLHFTLSRAYWHKSMWTESEQELEKGLRLLSQERDSETAHRTFERGGQKAVQQWQVDRIKAGARKEYISPLDIARECAYLGDKNETLKYLEEAYRERAPKLILLQTEPAFDLFHSEPRYQNIVRKMGLPVSQ
ncbi:MAG TPA: winged helix-turn-helix domain-containing protein [Terriglobales bacterium]|nr:winged helix-turn-helix domain-containing protein [Terriglobales bacterium]